MAVIELHKLLSEKENDRYRLSKFLQMLKANRKYFDLSAERISGWEIALQNEQEAINCLIELRDKVYAHTDKESRTIMNTVSLEKCQSLIDIVQNIFEDLNNIVFGTSYTFIHFERPKNDLQGIIDVLVMRDKLLEAAEREFE